MLTSHIHAAFGLQGIFEDLEDFELHAQKAAFKSSLKADTREFMALVNHFFQAPKFSYEGNATTTKAYQEQRSRLSIYNRLLKLYLNTNITIELAFAKAMALLEEKGITAPALQGRLSHFYQRLSAMVKMGMMEEKLIELETNTPEVNRAEKAPFRTRLAQHFMLCLIRLAYCFSSLMSWFKKPDQLVMASPTTKAIANDSH